MPFSATNGKATKLIRPGICFPIKEGGKKVALLVIDEGNQDTVLVQTLKPEKISVRVGDSPELLTGNVTVEAKSFEIHSQTSDLLVKVIYTAEEGEADQPR